MLRDKIIKEKFGESISNFLPNSHPAQVAPASSILPSDEPLSATFYKTAAAGVPSSTDYIQLITLQDIEKISNNLALPSL